MNRIYRIIIALLNTGGGSTIAKGAKDDVKDYLKLLEKWIDTRGLKGAIKQNKLMRLIVTRYLCGSPILVSEDIIGIDKTGFPKAIHFLKKYIDSGKSPQIQFVLTLLSTSRALDFKDKPDYRSITDPFSGSYQTLPLDWFAKFKKDFKLEIEPYPVMDDKVFFGTGKSGPLGHSLITALKNVAAYTGVHLTYFMLLSSEFLFKRVTPFRGIVNDSKGGNISRRLSLVYDPEGKTRIIAIFDYLTQSLLERYGKQMFDLLRKIPQDRTFTQNPHLKLPEGERYGSLDLKAATDRFPIKFQEDLLGVLMGDRLRAGAWKSAMVGVPFMSPEGDMLTYSVGQPMGARSSGPMFTLSHHCLVQYAAHLCGKYPFNDYILLGDDIVIANDMVAEQYIKLILDLGVEISPTKSHVSETTYEFAKRGFHNGKEVSGVPLNAITSTIKHPIEMLSAFWNLKMQGRFSGTTASTLELVKNLYGAGRGYSNKRIRHHLNIVENLYNMMRFLYIDDDSLSLRRILIAGTKDSDYAIPTDYQTMLNELFRVGAVVGNGLLFEHLRTISRYTLMTDAMMEKHGIIPEEFKEHREDAPILIAIRNAVSRVTTFVLKKLGPRIQISNFLELINEIDLIVPKNIGNKRKDLRLKYHISTMTQRIIGEFRFDYTSTANIAQSTKIAKAFVDLEEKIKRKP